MKRKFSKILGVGLALALLASFLVTAGPVAAAAPSPPTIDGVASLTEWAGATVIPVESLNDLETRLGKPLTSLDVVMGTVKVIAYPDYLYVLFVVVDSTDARTDYEGERGNDQISINVNPTAGVGTWGFPYDLIFETSALSDGACGVCPDDGGHHCLPWNPKVNSGALDGWATRWFPNNAQVLLPAELQSATTYTGVNRVTEWRLPLDSEAGATLKVGGAIDVGDGNSYMYPVGLDWNDPATFVDIFVNGNTVVGVEGDTGDQIIAINVPRTSINFGTVVPGSSSVVETIAVENVGTVPAEVTAMLDQAGSVFDYLELDGEEDMSNWEIPSLVGGAIQGVEAQLVVPREYSAQGPESATLIFLASAVVAQ